MASVRGSLKTATIAQNIDNASFQEKRLALEALGVKVTATTDHLDIQGILHIKSIEQTAGCLIVLDYDQATRKESLSILPQYASTPSR